MQTLQPITAMDWKLHYSKDKELIEYFDLRLKQINPLLSVNTFIGELIEIFPIKREWAARYIDGLFSASDKDRFKDRFKSDLLATIETGENTDDLNKFRKFGFESCEAGKGQKIQLGALGYMFFAVPTMEGIPTGKPKTVSYFNDAVYSIGEGATMVKFIFTLFSNDVKNFKTPMIPGQKLQWEGQKNQMYWVLNELKGQGLISNSHEQLADFLRQCVTGFEGTAHITITTELSRGKPPTKSKRPNLSGLPAGEKEKEG